MKHMKHKKMASTVTSQAKSMDRDLHLSIEEYMDRHPELLEVMKKFQVSRAAYERALSAISVMVETGPTYGLTTEGIVNANVSKTDR